MSSFVDLAYTAIATNDAMRIAMCSWPIRASATASDWMAWVYRMHTHHSRQW